VGIHQSIQFVTFGNPRATVSSWWQMTLPELTHFPVRTSFPPVAPQASTQPAGLFCASESGTGQRRTNPALWRRGIKQHTVALDAPQRNTSNGYRVGPADRPSRSPNRGLSDAECKEASGTLPPGLPLCGRQGSDIEVAIIWRGGNPFARSIIASNSARRCSFS